jgi:hypothetical protein
VLGIATLSLNDLKPDTEVVITQPLLKHLDTVKYKDKGDRGSITVKVSTPFIIFLILISLSLHAVTRKSATHC